MPINESRSRVVAHVAKHHDGVQNNYWFDMPFYRQKNLPS